MSSPTLGRGVKQLYEWLREIQRWSLANGRDYVWPHQDSLAKQLGVSVATIRRYLTELEDAGLIQRVRAQTGNRYYFLDPAEAAPKATPAPESPPLKVSGPTAHFERSHRSFCTMGPLKMSGPTAHFERCIDDELKEEEKEQQQQILAPPAESIPEPSPAAAADLFADLKTQDAKNALLGLDLSPPLAEAFAQADPGLALVVATAAAERFRDRRLKPVENKVGFVLAWLRYPLRCGFTRMDGGEWIPPKRSRESPAPIEERKRREEQRRQSEIDQARRDRQQMAEALDRWRAADPTTRAEILDLVRQRAGPHAPTFLLEPVCAAELDRRRQLARAP